MTTTDRLRRSSLARTRTASRRWAGGEPLRLFLNIRPARRVSGTDVTYQWRDDPIWARPLVYPAMVAGTDKGWTALGQQFFLNPGEVQTAQGLAESIANGAGWLWSTDGIGRAWPVDKPKKFALVCFGRKRPYSAGDPNTVQDEDDWKVVAHVNDRPAAHAGVRNFRSPTTDAGRAFALANYVNIAGGSWAQRTADLLRANRLPPIVCSLDDHEFYPSRGASVGTLANPGYFPLVQGDASFMASKTVDGSMSIAAWLAAEAVDLDGNTIPSFASLALTDAEADVASEYAQRADEMIRRAQITGLFAVFGRPMFQAFAAAAAQMGDVYQWHTWDEASSARGFANEGAMPLYPRADDPTRWRSVYSGRNHTGRLAANAGDPWFWRASDSITNYGGPSSQVPPSSSLINRRRERFASRLGVALRSTRHLTDRLTGTAIARLQIEAAVRAGRPVTYCVCPNPPGSTEEPVTAADWPAYAEEQGVEIARLRRNLGPGGLRTVEIFADGNYATDADTRAAVLRVVEVAEKEVLAARRTTIAFTPPAEPNLWTPLDLPAGVLVALYDAEEPASLRFTASGGNLTEWRDRSGITPARHAAAAAGGPLYEVAGLSGRACARQNSTHHCKPANIPLARVMIYALVRPSVARGTANNYGGIFATGGQAGTGAGLYSSVNNGAWGTYGATHRPAGTTLAADTTYVLGMRTAADGSGTFRTNGTVDGTFAATEGQGSGAAGAHLGGRQEDGQVFQGRIGAVVVTTTDLSPADGERVEGWLAHRWGVGSSLAVGHPFRSSPPTK